MIKYKNPYRLCSTNPIKGTNTLLSLLPEHFDNYFKDIIEDDESLRKNYICARRPLAGHGMRLNNIEQYYFNKFECWSAEKNNWEPKEAHPNYREQLLEIIKDEAEFNLFDQINNIAKNILEKNEQNHRSIQPLQPEKRLIFLQAGIGSGKTTMLHHFSRITIPDLAAKQLLPIHFISTIVNFNPIDENKDMELFWEEVVRGIRLKVEAITRMRNSEGWIKIAKSEIFDESGHYLPEIEFAANKEEEISQIVNKSKDDKIFLNRISQYLLNSKPQGIMVIIFDNLDMHGTENQLGYIRKLLNFVAGVENVIGIVATREGTIGNLNHLQDFHAYMHLDRMYMTTPYIGEMLSRRFESCIENINEYTARSVTICLDNQNTRISQVDVRNILKHMNTAIDIDTPADNPRPALSDQNDLRNSLTQFLNYATNSNARNALQLITHALKSWALDLTPIVTEYLWQRDKKITPIKLPPFSVDEIIRLAAVGQREFYQQEGDDYIVNLFSLGNLKPEPENGKFPNLYMYRVFQFFETKGGKVLKQDILNNFDIFGYTANTLGQVLEFMIKASFIESPQGNILENIRNLYSTAKLSFYFNTFGKMLVYLENIRNDTVIEYEATPHHIRESLTLDLLETYKFIFFLMEQEMKEYHFIKELSPHCQAKYKNIVCDGPICWKLLKSVEKRSRELFETQRHLFPIPDRQMILDHSKQLYHKIIDLSKENEIWPPVSANELRKMDDFMRNLTFI